MSDPIRQADFDAALAKALSAPVTPVDLRAGVFAAVARERPIDLMAARQKLEQQRRAALADLNRFYLRRCRDALLLGSGLLAVVGFSVGPLSHRLEPWFAAAAPMMAGFAMLLVGAVSGAVLWREFLRQSGSLRVGG